jgi:Kef-type K+ transport system membrane component KefB
MQQNARAQFRVRSQYWAEGEPARLLAELGVVGYVLIWLAKLGLAVALIRAARILKLTGQGAMSGGALAFAFFAFVGNSAFDHNWQALFFVGVGLMYLGVENALREALEARSAEGRG